MLIAHSPAHVQAVTPPMISPVCPGDLDRELPWWALACGYGCPVVTATDPGSPSLMARQWHGDLALRAARTGSRWRSPARTMSGWSSRLCRLARQGCAWSARLVPGWRRTGWSATTSANYRGLRSCGDHPGVGAPPPEAITAPAAVCWFTYILPDDLSRLRLTCDGGPGAFRACSGSRCRAQQSHAGTASTTQPQPNAGGAL